MRSMSMASTAPPPNEIVPITADAVPASSPIGPMAWAWISGLRKVRRALMTTITANQPKNQGWPPACHDHNASATDRHTVTGMSTTIIRSAPTRITCRLPVNTTSPINTLIAAK